MAEHFYILKDRFRPLWRGTPHPIYIDTTLNKRHCNNTDFKSSRNNVKNPIFCKRKWFFPISLLFKDVMDKCFFKNTIMIDSRRAALLQRELSTVAFVGTSI